MNKLKFLQDYVNRKDSPAGSKKKEKRREFWRILIAPYHLLMEYLTIRNFWKFITDEIGDNVELVTLLDKNEFGIGKWKIYKKDVLFPDDQIYVHDLDKLKLMYFNEFSEAIMTALKKSAFDVENYVSLVVDAYLHRESGVMLKMIEVSIMYYRYPLFLKAKRYFKYWIISVLISAAVVLTGLLTCGVI